MNETQSALNDSRETEYEYRLVAKNGSIHWVHDRGCFIFDADADITFSFQQFAEIVSVRIDRENVHIHWQSEIIRNEKIARSSWNVDRSIVLKSARAEKPS